VCSGGNCTCGCNQGLTCCGQTCNNLSLDNANCGACGLACGTGEACFAGACGCGAGGNHCGAGQACCGSACANLASDPNNCGVCGRVCAPGNVCIGGSCACGCPAGQTCCAQACSDLATDNSNCGACGNACGPQQTCVNGACVGNPPPMDLGLPASDLAGVVTCECSMANPCPLGASSCFEGCCFQDVLLGTCQVSLACPP
jgi:hypothetical protein